MPTSLDTFSILDRKDSEFSGELSLHPTPYIAIGDSNGGVTIIAIPGEFVATVDSGTKKRNQITLQKAFEVRDWIEKYWLLF